MRTPTRFKAGAVILSAVALTVTACGTGGGDTSGGATADAGSGTGEIKVWGHQGEEGEVAALQAAVAGFNSSQKGVKATLQLIPSADYTKTVSATSPDQLPDVLEYDGPLMASFAYDKKLAPVEGLVSAQTIGNQTDSVKTQNTYQLDKKLYGVSMYDSGLGVYGNKALLDAAGVTYPKGLGDAWTADQFQTALEKLAAKDPDQKVLDVKENYGGEWPTYGFLPIVNSAGALAIKDNKAEGNLNSAPVVKAVQQFAGWRKFVDPNSDDKAFTDGRVALSWVGHWQYNPYNKALGQKLVVLPLPDFGAGTKSGQGSWAWGIGGSSKNGKAAGLFLDYLLNDSNVTAMTTANAAPPGTKTVIATDPLYKPGGPLQLFADGLSKTCGANPPTTACVATPRPVTPAYPVFSQQFSQAFLNIYKGGDAQAELDKAAKAIDQDFTDNNNYTS
ncbi:carbohydrate ABC transporter substrate-binding protein (CUT1 family) [Humibacillus xanthopallidus]|uniref:Carbohydrate ABC transporter substrate-binding protein (CUT1 family) n=1 Tax=Humibacillus xanthopallidus TaxID=412689 RepID=A0A543PLX0_9MICO|nr:sugar ABC transporter substrate-binding protein [Humibacillus xanthopallidus]TQN45070.1 carbohydrate ABC transporter substrate-binding protein (CUT1 family) [Humibacillus xanthopallidus]